MKRERKKNSIVSIQIIDNKQMSGQLRFTFQHHDLSFPVISCNLLSWDKTTHLPVFWTEEHNTKGRKRIIYKAYKAVPLPLRARVTYGTKASSPVALTEGEWLQLIEVTWGTYAPHGVGPRGSNVGQAENAPFEGLMCEEMSQAEGLVVRVTAECLMKNMHWWDAGLIDHTPFIQENWMKWVCIEHKQQMQPITETDHAEFEIKTSAFQEDLSNNSW